MRDPWELEVKDFVLEHLPPRPSRVLEIGCGEGWLTRALLRSGYRAKGIDPRAPEEVHFEQVTVEEFADRKPYDAIVAVLSLHHIRDVPAALNKIKSLLQADGRVLIVEFTWENLDDATLSWCFERLRRDSDSEDGWLRRCCNDWRLKLQERGRISAREHVREWADSEQLHPGKEILDSLREVFHEAVFQWAPYLYPDLEGITAREEQTAIDRGEIQPASFRFVGTSTAKRFTPDDFAATIS